ncbi:hypothetical protein FSP39_006446 [Pinctada imbricata]|uniref:Beta-lactamase-related domain-containing protein n=1 Tax=Pinctada imbricata TaxID=66713 RepID=A0AA89BQM0_PINIB|nr:hypothetical protein FSP39_006446 [Pinctada imbricata]
MGFLRQAVVVLVVAYVLNKIPSYLKPTLTPRFDGYFHPEFRKVAEAFKKYVENGEERGASMAFYHKGELLVDVWGGFADPVSGRHWKNDTLCLMYSATKGVTALLVAQFVDRGLLDYKKKVSDYWPKFGQNGKKDITLETLITHQGGLAATNGTIPLEWMITDPDKADAFAERQKPTWKPGTKLGYHGITYGLFLDPLMKKADPKHRNIGQILRDEVSVPFGIDIYNGLPYDELHRVARQVPLGFGTMLWDYLTSFNLRYYKLAYNLFGPTGTLKLLINSGFDQIPAESAFDNPDIMRVPMSSYMGFGNGRSLGKLFGIVANGGKHNGKQLLSQKSIDRLAKPIVNKPGEYGLLRNMGLGVFYFPTGKGHEVMGTIGAGGQIAYADLENHVGFGYVTNHGGSFGFNDDHKVVEYQKLFYECLENYLKSKK